MVYGKMKRDKEQEMMRENGDAVGMQGRGTLQEIMRFGV